MEPPPRRVEDVVAAIEDDARGQLRQVDVDVERNRRDGIRLELEDAGAFEAVAVEQFDVPSPRPPALLRADQRAVVGKWQQAGLAEGLARPRHEHARLQRQVEEAAGAEEDAADLVVLLVTAGDAGRDCAPEQNVPPQFHHQSGAEFATRLVELRLVGELDAVAQTIERQLLHRDLRLDRLPNDTGRRIRLRRADRNRLHVDPSEQPLIVEAPPRLQPLHLVDRGAGREIHRPLDDRRLRLVEAVDLHAGQNLLRALLDTDVDVHALTLAIDAGGRVGLDSVET